LYGGPAPTEVDVPLYDIFGSTIELVNVTNGNTPETIYTYDPGGEVTTNNNNARSQWPFLYHGLEQEYPDTWKLYWEPGGNVYIPIPSSSPSAARKASAVAASMWMPSCAPSRAIVIDAPKYGGASANGVRAARISYRWQAKKKRRTGEGWHSGRGEKERDRRAIASLIPSQSRFR